MYLRQNNTLQILRRYKVIQDSILQQILVKYFLFFHPSRSFLSFTCYLYFYSFKLSHRIVILVLSIDIGHLRYKKKMTWIATNSYHNLYLTFI